MWKLYGNKKPAINSFILWRVFYAALILAGLVLMVLAAMELFFL